MGTLRPASREEARARVRQFAEMLRLQWAGPTGEYVIMRLFGLRRESYELLLNDLEALVRREQETEAAPPLADETPPAKPKRKPMALSDEERERRRVRGRARMKAMWDKRRAEK